MYDYYIVAIGECGPNRRAGGCTDLPKRYPIPKNSLGAKIIELLKADRRDILWLEEQSGVPKSTIYGWIGFDEAKKGRPPHPRLDLLYRICDALRVEPSFFDISEPRQMDLKLEIIDIIDTQLRRLRGHIIEETKAGE